jgi:hypothetical protein
MQSVFPHFIITRIGFGIYDEDRLAKMIELFSAVTFPSIGKQKNQEFTWLIVVDEACAQVNKKQIMSLIAGRANYHCVPIDVTRLSNVRVACFDWIWDHCQTFILEKGLIKNPEEYVVTSIIDADDAWNQEVTGRVASVVSDQMPNALAKLERRGTWLRHSVGLAITFPDGYVWFVAAKKVWPLKNEFRSMSIFVVSRFSSGISACSCRHSQWRKFAEILDFEVLSIPSREPMWIYSRHDEAVESWNASQGMPMPVSFDERWEKVFGIDCKKIDQWLLDYPTNEESKTFSSSAALQYDLMFRIAIWNRKIRALEKMNSSDGASGTQQNDSLTQAMAERQKLVQELQKGRKTPEMS